MFDFFCLFVSGYGEYDLVMEDYCSVWCGEVLEVYGVIDGLFIDVMFGW